MRALLGHLSAATTSTNALRGSHKTELVQQAYAWTTSLRSAVVAASQNWLRSLADLADSKAKKLELQVASLRRAQWRCRIGAVSSEPGGTACPTKYAYRWVRGLTGWQRSPIGQVADNDAIPAAPLEERRCTGAICNELAVQIYGGRKLFQNIQDPKNTTPFLIVSKNKPSLASEQLLVCVTCPTEDCYRQTILDFSASGFPLMFTSISGEFSETLPCFLQFENAGKPDALRELLTQNHRTLIGGTSFEESLSACTANLFDQDY